MNSRGSVLQMQLHSSAPVAMSDSPARYQSPWTSNEMITAIRLLDYFEPSTTFDTSRTFPKNREHLAKILGTGTKQAQEILNYRKNKERPPPEVRRTSGWRKSIEPELSEDIESHVRDQNLQGEHVSIRTIKTHLKSLNYTMSTSTVNRRLHALEVQFGTGQRRHHLYQSPGNVAYRYQYARARLENITRMNSPLPKIPEVFLDESYCHVGHHSRCTWYKPGDVILDHGRGPMLVMFGAFAVYSDHGRIKAEMVQRQLHIWPVSGCAHMSKPAGQKRGRGRPPRDDEVAWDVVPPSAIEANLAPDTRDYHGNFNSAIFEELFEDLCKDLAETYHTGCVIHMDGAKYHTRKENPVPTIATKKEDIMSWVEDNNITLPPPKRRKHTAKEALEHIASLQTPSVRASSSIAQRYGHKIMITPPYHCEVQPIERVWAFAKNPIALNPIIGESPLELRNRLYENFAAITKNQLIFAWKDALRACEGHLSQPEANEEQNTGALLEPMFDEDDE